MRLRPIGGLVGSSLVLTWGAFTPAHAAEDITINVVAINDFHGQIDDHTVQWAGTVAQLLDDAPATNSLLISAGDNVGSSTPESSLQSDDPTIDLLNAVGVDASAVGNHEFDWGYDDLVNHLMVRADFPILGANVKKSDWSDALEASATFIVAGLRVAVIGAVTDSTPRLVPWRGIRGLRFIDIAFSINAEVDRLNALPAKERPDVIIAAIHEGAPWGSRSLRQAYWRSYDFRRIIQRTSPDVDAIISGHTHGAYVVDIPIPGEPGRTRPMIQTGYFGRNVGQISLTVDAETGDVTTYSARNVARVTTPDAALIAKFPSLTRVKKLREAAVRYAKASSTP